jgi:glycosyltransferase involved in cell wall biosynthesis
MTGRVGSSSSSDGPLKVCFIVGTLGRGGAERQLVYMLRALRSHAVDTRVLCLTRGEPIQSEIENLGVSVEWVGANPSQPVRLAAIVGALRREHADVVQSTHFYANAYAAVTAVLTGARSVGAVRGDVLEGLKANPLAGWADLRLPEFLVVNSRPARDAALERRRSAARVFLVPNAVDSSRFGSRAHRRPAAASGELRLLFAGRLTEEKRADRFLRLVERAGRELPNRRVEARLIGDGPDRAGLEALRSSLRLDPSRVQFVGEVSDVSPEYYWADVLVLCSDHEGTPNVLLEAMASGLPVVATAVGGVPDLLCHGGGLMVRPQSDEALLAAVLKLANDPRLAESLAEEGARYVAHNHSLDSLGRRLDAVYKTAMGQGTSCRVSP